jgi:hypothetical protein
MNDEGDAGVERRRQPQQDDHIAPVKAPLTELRRGENLRGFVHTLTL